MRTCGLAGLWQSSDAQEDSKPRWLLPLQPHQDKAMWSRSGTSPQSGAKLVQLTARNRCYSRVTEPQTSCRSWACNYLVLHPSEFGGGLLCGITVVRAD